MWLVPARAALAQHRLRDRLRHRGARRALARRLGDRGSRIAATAVVELLERGDARRASTLGPVSFEPLRRVGLGQRVQRRGERVEVAAPVHVRRAAQRPDQRERAVRAERIVARRRRQPRVEGEPRRLTGGVLHTDVEHGEPARGLAAAVELLGGDPVGDDLFAGEPASASSSQLVVEVASVYCMASAA